MKHRYNFVHLMMLYTNSVLWALLLLQHWFSKLDIQTFNELCKKNRQALSKITS